MKRTFFVTNPIAPPSGGGGAFLSLAGGTMVSGSQIDWADGPQVGSDGSGNFDIQNVDDLNVISNGMTVLNIESFAVVNLNGVQLALNWIAFGGAYNSLPVITSAGTALLIGNPNGNFLSFDESANTLTLPDGCLVASAGTTLQLGILAGVQIQAAGQVAWTDGPTLGSDGDGNIGAYNLGTFTIGGSGGLVVTGGPITVSASVPGQLQWADGSYVLGGDGQVTISTGSGATGSMEFANAVLGTPTAGVPTPLPAAPSSYLVVVVDGSPKLIPLLDP